MVEHPNEVPETTSGQAFLIFDKWDDWGKFRTQFQLVVFDYEGKKFSPGSVKIGEFDLHPATALEIKPGFRAPTIDKEFDALDDRHFSLGTNETYYETLNRLPVELHDKLLKGLNDC